jgi:hypothetical protein
MGRRRHLKVGGFARDGKPQEAFLRFARDKNRSASTSDGQPFGLIQSQISLRLLPTMARCTSLQQQRADLFLK